MEIFIWDTVHKEALSKMGSCRHPKRQKGKPNTRGKAFGCEGEKQKWRNVPAVQNGSEWRTYNACVSKCAPDEQNCFKLILATYVTFWVIIKNFRRGMRYRRYKIINYDFIGCLFFSYLPLPNAAAETEEASSCQNPGVWCNWSVCWTHTGGLALQALLAYQRMPTVLSNARWRQRTGCI